MMKEKILCWRNILSCAFITIAFSLVSCMNMRPNTTMLVYTSGGDLPFGLPMRIATRIKNLDMQKTTALSLEKVEVSEGVDFFIGVLGMPGPIPEDIRVERNIYPQGRRPTDRRPPPATLRIDGYPSLLRVLTAGCQAYGMSFGIRSDMTYIFGASPETRFNEHTYFIEYVATENGKDIFQIRRGELLCFKRESAR